jgi:hypothetical protein
MPKSIVMIATCAVAALLAGTASAETYKWVDAQGQVHYSDRPPPAGAEKVELLPAQTFHARESTKSTAPGSAPKSGDGPSAYAAFEMRRPRSGDVITNSAGTVSVELRLEPALQPGYSIWLYLDGKRVDGLSATATSFQLSNVVRGEHRLVAAVTNAAGRSVISTETVPFMVRQTSIANPPQGPALRPVPTPVPRPTPLPKKP